MPISLQRDYNDWNEKQDNGKGKKEIKKIYTQTKTNIK